LDTHPFFESTGHLRGVAFLEAIHDIHETIVTQVQHSIYVVLQMKLITRVMSRQEPFAKRAYFCPELRVPIAPTRLD
jgi:hypothetical protein